MDIMLFIERCFKAFCFRIFTFFSILIQPWTQKWIEILYLTRRSIHLEVQRSKTASLDTKNMKISHLKAALAVPLSELGKWGMRVHGRKSWKGQAVHSLLGKGRMRVLRKPQHCNRCVQAWNKTYSNSHLTNGPLIALERLMYLERPF
jgi:hypothetical protein